NVNTDNIKAEMNDGVLTVKISRSEAAKPKRIEIAGGS
ncbi:Hsp20 family protein, partial [candidate division KSB1 bacterium]|nr:Hsp20 family protein [candidate division KSB1 bacterium]